MIVIKLENNRILEETIATKNYFESRNISKDLVLDNYYKQDMYILERLEKGMVNAENELCQKWGLKDRLYIDVATEGKCISYIIMENLTDKYMEAEDMSEINNISVLEKCKNQIINYFKEELDNYAINYNLNMDTLYNIKSDVPEVVSKHFDKITDELLNDRVRDNLKSLCNKLENAYKDENYDKMNEISEKIENYFSNKKTIYRDYELLYRIKIDLVKNQMVQNKLKNNMSGKLSSLEEELIEKFETISK